MKTRGWEQKMTSILEDAINTPYVIGSHDCFTVACEVLNAQIGEKKFGEDIRGQYNSFETSVELLKRWGKTFEESFDKYFGLPRIDAKMAQRGDICVLRTADAMKHLAVCVGERCACLGPEGMRFVSMRAAICVWAVR